MDADFLAAASASAAGGADGGADERQLSEKLLPEAAEEEDPQQQGLLFAAAQPALQQQQGVQQGGQGHNSYIGVVQSEQQGVAGGVGGGPGPYYDPTRTPADAATTATPGVKQPDRYRDAFAAALFLGHLAFVFYMGLVRGLPSIAFSVRRFNGTVELHLGGLFLVFLLACCLAFAWTAAVVAILTRFVESIIPAALYFAIGSELLTLVVSAYKGYWTGAVVAGFFLFWTASYARSVKSRLPLCSTLLQTALTAIQDNAGIALVAYGTVFALCLYTIVWILAGIGVYVHSPHCDSSSSDDGSSTPSCTYRMHATAAFGFILAYAWTAQVLKLILHATASGVVATWFFAPDDASSFWSPAIADSLARSSTYSLGSLCLAGLLTATVQVAYRFMLWVRRRSTWAAFLSPIHWAAMCCLGVLERLISYFHRYAIVYVAIYGYDFLTSGQKTAALFAARGWTAYINDDLVAGTLTMTSWVVGIATGALVLLLYNPKWVADYFYNNDDYFNDDDASSSSSPSSYRLVFSLSLLLGTAVSNLILSIVTSAVDTVLVSFAEAPLDFERNHPGLYRQMVEAWSLVYPNEFADASPPTSAAV